MKYCSLLFSLLICLSLNAQTQQTEKETEELPLEILSWNIYMLPSITVLSKDISKSYKVKRAKAIAEWVLNNNFDIIVWQENFNIFSGNKLSKNLHDEYPYQYGPANKAIFPKTSSGIVVYSKMPLQVLKQIKYNEKTLADAWANKGAMLLQGEWNGQVFQVVGTHLQAGAGEKGDKIRLSQMQQIKNELLTPYKQENVPQFICGDMNTRRRGKNYKDMKTTFDVEDYVLQSSNGSTCRSAETGNEIDFIFVKNNGYEFNKMVRTLLIPEMEWGKNGEVWLSDHHAIWGTFEF